MTPEQKFYQWFRKQLPINADCCRIETSTMGGMPDTNICWMGQEIWVELKVFVGGRTLIRPEQNAWMCRRAAAGGKIFLMARHESGEIAVWWPDLFHVIPHGKYLHVNGNPTWHKSGQSIINFLFT